MEGKGARLHGKERRGCDMREEALLHLIESCRELRVLSFRHRELRLALLKSDLTRRLPAPTKTLATVHTAYMGYMEYGRE